MPVRHLPFVLVALLAMGPPAAALSISDDSGREIRLPGPARRIVSLSPHITELLFAAGAGARIAATVRFSDYPAGARSIPRIGDTYSLDMERLVALQPDLVIVWQSGTRGAVIDEIERAGLPVYYSEPRSLADIAATLRRFGQLAGSEASAAERSRAYLQRLESLRHRYADRAPVRVFYQFWHRPVFTVNGAHLIDKVITLCGGRNVFADLPPLTPRVDTEAVLERDPQVIIASGEDAARPDWLDNWRQWPELGAVKDDHLYTIPPDLLLRHTPRILDGAEMMCEFIDKARQDSIAQRREGAKERQE